MLGTQIKQQFLHQTYEETGWKLAESSDLMAGLPDFKKGFVHVDALPINQEFEIGDFWAVELSL